MCFRFLIVLICFIVFLSAHACAGISDGGKGISPKEVRADSDFDGKIDIVESFSDDGQIKQRTIDTNADGVMDECVYFEEGIPVRSEIDADNNGEPEMIITYNSDGQPVEAESDTNNDSTIDEWTVYENGQPSKIKKDSNFDGEVDTWIDY